MMILINIVVGTFLIAGFLGAITFIFLIICFWHDIFTGKL